MAAGEIPEHIQIAKNGWFFVLFLGGLNPFGFRIIDW
jgi:hypothetical protein